MEIQTKRIILKFLGIMFTLLVILPSFASACKLTYLTITPNPPKAGQFFSVHFYVVDPPINGAVNLKIDGQVSENVSIDEDNRVFKNLIVNKAGNYTLLITVFNNTNSTLFRENLTIIPFASFRANPTSGNAPITVTFVDNSIGAYETDWDFGDGNTLVEYNSNDPNHTYNNSGTYLVTLIAKGLNGAGQDQNQTTITVTPPSINVPEFPSIAVPAVALLGIVAYFGRKKL
jgi:PKD repeat protein